MPMPADPFNKDTRASYGTAEEVAPGVRRLTCPNPSPYTFTGTQTYLVGTGDVALIDPGPDRPEHLDAILAALGPGERISHILITHTHVDHSPGTRTITARTGARTYAWGEHGTGLSPTMQRLVDQGVELGGGEGADLDFSPDQVLEDDARVEGGDWALRAVHTPGHLANHLSFELEGEGIVFTGDMVMGFATTLVSPPSGDMAAFMASLDRLAARGDDRLYLPGHGHPIDDPAGMIRYQIGHRQSRFQQILTGLEEGPRDATALTQAIYTEVDPALLPAARRNVLASLIGLVDQGRVGCAGGISVDAVFHLA